MIERRQLLAMLGVLAAWPCAGTAAPARVFTARIAVERNRVLIAIGIDGTGPYTFMIDTGTYISFVRPELAKRLKLPVVGSERTSGIAGREGQFTLYRAREFVIGGGIRQRDVVLQDSFRFRQAADIQGALAAGILTSSDTELDFDAGELRIYPDGRGERPGYAAVDATFPRPGPVDRGSRKLTATLELDGRPVRCVVDTGAPHVLMLTRRAAGRLGYLTDARPWSPFRPDGIGGTGTIGRIVRGQSLALGDVRAERPLVTLVGDDFLDDADGIVGLSFIRRLNLSIDASARRLWVKPSEQPLVAERYGLSGLWLDRVDGAITVAAVGSGSPAARAGIVVGDRIAGDWSQLLASLGGAPGTRIAIPVVRAGAPAAIELELAAYL